MKKRALATLISSALMTAPLVAVAEPEQFFVTPFAGVQNFDSERDMGEHGVWGLGGEYQFSDHFGVELDYTRLIDSIDYGQPNTDVDYDRLSLDGVVYLNKSKMAVPYFKFGVGHDRYDYKDASKDENTDVSAGLGMRFRLIDRLSMRAEVKAVQEVDDSHLNGVYTLGFSYAFGGVKPVEAPAPVVAAPAPVVAAAPADSDRDGVIDSVDQCPNTPPGKRVGSSGCDCDYEQTTNFAFNSAVLSDDDKAKLDQLAEVLVNPKLSFVSGAVDGYTDSKGKPEYNQKLSERRAQAVADYLSSKGVATGSKWSVQGFGEADPVADNSTEEGRAQNRRVVIRRTDCPAK